MVQQLGDECIYLRLQQLQKGLLQFTDTTNAYRLLKEYGKDIRYNSVWKKWLVWNGCHWDMDDGYLIHDKGLQIIRGIYQELLKTSDFRDRIDIEKHAMQSESARRRKALIEVASWIPELNVKTDDLDKDPWLLNVRNGTINLQTGEINEHNADNLITRCANVDYDKNADCPVWKKFLMEIMNYNSDLIRFIQNAAGWAITGDTSEQTMFILFGTGANGKSTFLNTIMNLLGDYASATPTQTFMKKTGDQMTNDLARLRGARFVTTTETEQGRRLSEPLIKQITGNDRITARFLYGEFFNFLPTFKIWMATNHKPVIKGTDHGIWRRIKLIPFTNRIEEEKQDKYLEQKLMQESSGILNWLLEGARRWCNEGLKAPKIVLNATAEYRAEMDVVGDFINERCIQISGVAIKARELFKCYQDWCEENNERAVSERFFGLRLKEIGIDQKRSNDGRYWQNIHLRA
ncbi:MAG: phage/plasmid primase, P4 family [Treponema sp.]|nr:phage/plasmid primase, P4 family [Treponema sp.]